MPTDSFISVIILHALESDLDKVQLAKMLMIVKTYQYMRFEKELDVVETDDFCAFAFILWGCFRVHVLARLHCKEQGTSSKVAWFRQWEGSLILMEH